MVSKNYWNRSIEQFVELVKKNKKIEKITIQNIEFFVLPGVFSPVYSSDTSWFAERIIPLVKNQKFLEIGSGSGIIACLASLGGASSVVATDINSEAIKNIKINANMHSLNISVRKGSVFNPIKKNETFDLIFWNHPFQYIEKKIPKKDNIQSSVSDTKYRFLNEYFLQGKNHLNENGKLLLGTSNIARINEIKKIADKNGYVMNLIEKGIVPVFKEKKVKMDLRIYECFPV